MVKLSRAISKVIVDQYGQHEFLRRLADPLWFQAFGCVLGFDWHSSGVTTVVTGVLKQALTVDTHGICIAGGKGNKSREAKHDIPRLAERYYNLSSAKIGGLLYASKMTEKVDTAAVQDGYSMYHHVLLFDKDGDCTVVQQGMNVSNMMARRYDWLSNHLKSFISDPHAGIICASKNSSTLNMTSLDSEESQKVSLELATGNTQTLKSVVVKMSRRQLQEQVTRDTWIDKRVVIRLKPLNISAGTMRCPSD